MSLHVGIVGLPNVGKSTLFKALTKKQVDIANYPFCTIDPNVGVVTVPDARLDALAKVSQSEKIIPTTIEFVDIAGLVQGAHKGEGLGNKFLANIRECDAIAHVVRAFTDKDIIHVSGSVNPDSDAEIIMLELIMADLAAMEKRREAVLGKAKSGSEEAKKELEAVEKVLAILGAGKRAATVSVDAEEAKLIRSFQLLTMKPVLTVMNVDETNVTRDPTVIPHLMRDPENKSMDPGSGPGMTYRDDTVSISAKIEAELAELAPEEAQTYLKELGWNESGLDRLIKKSYELLHLITYFTSGPKETRAWTITAGTKAPQAAGVIHTDFEKGFIRAEVMRWKDLVDCGSEAAAREKGLFRLEGKEYVVQDGDVMHFRFAV
ncbi:redox-regulated ATPase YchF [Candidatus Uhrbacteria bacterium]|nr:redox-regulated ATPase YchF [Candidatus Uhrbacteria bacterium]